MKNIIEESLKSLGFVQIPAHQLKDGEEGYCASTRRTYVGPVSKNKSNAYSTVLVDPAHLLETGYVVRARITRPISGTEEVNLIRDEIGQWTDYDGNGWDDKEIEVLRVLVDGNGAIINKPLAELND